MWMWWITLALASGDAELARLEAAAAAEHDSLPALEARADALRARAEVAGAWPDPMLAVEYSNVPVTSFSLRDHAMAGVQLKVQQTFHPAGWSAAKRSVLAAAAVGVDAHREEVALQLRVAVRTAFWELTRTRHLERVTQEHLARTLELLDAARSTYELGRGTQHAMLRLEVLRDRLGDDIVGFQRTDRVLRAGLAGAIGAAPPVEVVTPDTLEPLAPPLRADWRAVVAEHRPAVDRLDAEGRTADAMAAAARQDRFIDPTAWVGYRIRSLASTTDPGVDLVSLGVSVPVPSGSGRRARGEEAAAAASRRASDHDRDALLDRSDAGFDAVMARWERSYEQTGTYSDRLLPSARTALESVFSDFTVGRAEFGTLYDAEIELLTLDRAWIAATVDTHLQEAAGLAILGVMPLEAAP